MGERARLRVVGTHDFCCAYPPSTTSYGSLPGGEGLRRTVDALRERSPTVRADGGDFAAPGALATLSDGKAGFAAAADLGIDVGVVGNHEFEWGVEHLREHAPETGYPLLCANAPESGLPPAAVVETEGGVVGFVGLTCPDPGVYVSAPDLDPDLASVVARHSKGLRASGADWVVVLLHDGVDWRFGAGATRPASRASRKPAGRGRMRWTRSSRATPWGAGSAGWKEPRWSSPGRSGRNSASSSSSGARSPGPTA
jgi:2',3'-cyclic-nucleotide 2'-phosphodiesterase (5'-nucleotidase family)